MSKMQFQSLDTEISQREIPLQSSGSSSSQPGWWKNHKSSQKSSHSTLLSGARALLKYGFPRDVTTALLYVTGNPRRWLRAKEGKEKEDLSIWLYVCSAHLLCVHYCKGLRVSQEEQYLATTLNGHKGGKLEPLLGREDIPIEGCCLHCWSPHEGQGHCTICVWVTVQGCSMLTWQVAAIIF